MLFLELRKNALKRKKENWQKEKEIIIEETELQKDMNKYIKKFHIPTSKIIMLFLFINCTLIELFTGYITIQNFKLVRDIGGMVDLTPLITLITAVVGQVTGFAIYSIKATKENIKGGIVYDSAMKQFENEEQQQEEEIQG